MNRSKIYVVILFLCLIVFEVFSYISSKKTLMSLTGLDLWATLIAFSFCAVDLAGLPLIQMKRTNPDFIRMLSFAWILTVFGDTAMTWYAVALQTSTKVDHTLVRAGIVSPEVFTVYVPLGIAVLTWLVQTMLVHWLNGAVEEVIEDKTPVAPQRPPMSQSQLIRRNRV